jgi:hypothetical protein
MNFKPWKRDDRDLEALGADNWHDQAVSARFAYALMLMSEKK